MSLKKRFLFFLFFASIVAAACVVLVFPTIQFQFVGAIRGEAFYNGKPTTYWAAAMSADPSTPERQLGRTLREGGSKAVPVLAELLADESTNIRGLALMYLEQNQQNQEDISASAGSLADYLLAPDSFEFSRAMALLKRIDEATARGVLVRCMQFESDWKKRAEAIAAASLFGPKDEDVLGNLESCLDDPELSVRVASAQKMLEFKHRHPRMPGVFLESLEGNGGPFVLPWMEVTAEYHDETLPKLFQLLHSPVPAVLDNAARAFRAASLSLVDVPLLIRELRNDRADIRGSAVSHLGRFAGKARPALQALIEVVKSESDENVRQDAVTRLGQLGSAATMAVPALTALVRRENWPQRFEVVTSLLAIDPENQEAVEAVSELLTDSTPAFPGDRMSRREFVVVTLGNFGPSVQATVPVFLKALNDKSLAFRCQTALALVKIGHRDEKLVAVLIKSLQSNNVEVIQNACAALQMIGPPAKTAIPELRKAITDFQPNLHRNTPPELWGASIPEAYATTACAAALWRVEPENELSQKTLAALLHDPVWECRYAAATAIASLGVSAKKLTPMVAEALEHESRPSLQETLRYALDSMSQAPPN
jgi:HEAT repeat protein